MPETELGEVEGANEAVDRPNRIVRTDIVLDPRRKQTGLLAALAALERAIRHKPNRTCCARKCPQFLPSLVVGQISSTNSPHLIPQEGRIAIVTNAGWDAVDAAASARMRSQGCSNRERSTARKTNDAVSANARSFDGLCPAEALAKADRVRQNRVVPTPVAGAKLSVARSIQPDLFGGKGIPANLGCSPRREIVEPRLQTKSPPPPVMPVARAVCLASGSDFAITSRNELLRVRDRAWNPPRQSREDFMPNIRVLATDLEFPEGTVVRPDGSVVLVESRGRRL